MDSSSIELPGSEIASITLNDGILRIQFSRAYIIKTMTGSIERTRWWQAGELLLYDAKLQEDLPPGQLICAGGDVSENFYTYRDMIPIPLEGRGKIKCLLKFKDKAQVLHVEAQRISLQLESVAKYIEHIRP